MARTCLVTLALSLMATMTCACGGSSSGDLRIEVFELRSETPDGHLAIPDSPAPEPGASPDAVIDLSDIEGLHGCGFTFRDTPEVGGLAELVRTAQFLGFKMATPSGEFAGWVAPIGTAQSYDGLALLIERDASRAFFEPCDYATTDGVTLGDAILPFFDESGRVRLVD
jgi:hypothetical protein